MRERLKFLLEKNAAKREREEKLASFVRELGLLVDFDPKSLSYSSFEETASALDRIRDIVKKHPNGVEWNFSYPAVLDESMHVLCKTLPDAESLLILCEHYLFVGAMRLRLSTCLENTKAFLALGEETIIVLDSSLQNYLRIAEYQDDFTDSGLEYSIKIIGRTWPLSVPRKPPAH